jgi:transcription initiation factor TFIIIB Brf1 subunit/transcription initiation factor TFIIB
MILTVGIAGIAAALIYVLYKHHIAETSNDNIINAIQDVREKSGESYTALKQSLKEWNTLYKKDASGNLIEVPDKRIEDYVSKKLAEYGRLNTKK